MNGTAGQEGETVSNRSTRTCFILTQERSQILISTLNMPESANWVELWGGDKKWETNIKVRETFINIWCLSSVSVFHLGCDWCKGCIALWHRSLLLIISQHALGRVRPSSGRPAKDLPTPTEFCNHTPHSAAAACPWSLESNSHTEPALVFLGP